MTEDRQALAEYAASLEDRMPPAAGATGVNRSTDQVAAAMRTYVDDGAISSDDHATLVWFFTHGKTEKNYTSFDEFGKLVDYSGSTVSRIFSGKYTGDLREAVKRVENYRHLNAERAKMASDTFIENSIWDRVRNVCDLAYSHKAIVRIVGPSQIGKTHSLLEYKRRAKANVYYARVPAAPTFRNFQECLSEAVGLNSSLRSEDIRRRLPGALNQLSVLVVDELHELALSAGRGTAMKCMEWLREVWDVSHCAMVACGTKSMEDDLIYSAGLKGWLEQFDQRCIRKLVLPMTLPAGDIAMAARAYGFPEPDSSVEHTLKSMRMNRLCTSFKLCQQYVRNRARKGGSAVCTWDDFKRVVDHNFGGV